MVAYKSDPLGLNDTVVPQNKRIRQWSRIGGKGAFASKLKKKKNSSATSSNSATASHEANDSTTTTTTKDYANNTSSASSTHNNLEDSKPPAQKVIKDKSSHALSVEGHIASMPSSISSETTIKTSRHAKGDVDADISEEEANVRIAVSETTQPREDLSTRFPPRENRLTRWCCPHDNNHGGKERSFRTNQKLLTIAFISFFMFTTAQLVATFAAHSMAMLGDTAAMFIDCLTYLTNFVAERRKHQFAARYQPPVGVDDPERLQVLYERAKRKMVLTWEFVPPLASVICLLGVTAYIFEDSVRVLVQDVTTKPKELQEEPNLRLMMSFSLTNLLVDILNVTCFAKARHCFGYLIVNNNTTDSSSNKTPTDDKTITITTTNTADIMEDGRVGETMFNGVDDDVDKAKVGVMEKNIVCHNACDCPIAKSMSANRGVQEEDASQASDKVANLNMCSAYTHVLADTLRSISVILAALVALVVDEVTAEAADSTAALVVSFIILMTVVPLIRGLWATFWELWHIRNEEQAERVLAQQQQENQQQQL